MPLYEGDSRPVGGTAQLPEEAKLAILPAVFPTENGIRAALWQLVGNGIGQQGLGHFTRSLRILWVAAYPWRLSRCLA